MYPNLYYAFRDLGIELPFLQVIQTFGFFVALAFLAGAYVLTQELKRREFLGWLQGTPEKVIVGAPASTVEIATSALIGFVLGYKILGLILLSIKGGADLQSYILSIEGNLLGGVLLGGYMAYQKYQSKKKAQLPKPKEEMVMVMPHQRVPDIIIMAAVGGLIGAKIFHNLENWSEFIQDPIGNLFTADGLTFYGGLLVAAFIIIRYGNKKQIHWKHLVDSAAPALMLAYAIGRMGCQFSGDGDWGIHNSAYVSQSDGRLVAMEQAAYPEALEKNALYFNRHFGSLEEVPSMHFPKPASLSFLPDFFFAYNYPRNVVNAGVPIAGCTDDKYCNVLPVGVFPTPLYEILVCGICFLILMGLRKRITVPGVIFGIYLILNGAERFFIEKIRVNTKYDLFGFHPTQAEIIATFLVIAGIGLIFYARKTAHDAPTSAA